MQVTPCSGKVSPYVRTLALDLDSYVSRTRIFIDIMYVKGGLDRAERELGALVASCINGCTYCASVQARRNVELTGNTAAVERIYRFGLHEADSPRIRAIIDFCEALSITAPFASADHIARLRPRTERYRNSRSCPFRCHFGWANRLMHTLGHSH
jgi:uncharacterized peroxidase-related enzyme